MRSLHFTEKEMACRGEDCCEHSCPMNPIFMKVLDKLRDIVATPVYVNSGYRCNKHNKAEGGASRSKHKLGIAADIYSKSVTLDVLAEAAEGLGLYVIKYDTFIHVDGRFIT